MSTLFFSVHEHIIIQTEILIYICISIKNLKIQIKIYLILLPFLPHTNPQNFRIHTMYINFVGSLCVIV